MPKIRREDDTDLDLLETVSDDPNPSPADDVEPPLDAGVSTSDDDATDAEDSPQPVDPFSAKRDAITAKARERRASEMEGDLEDMNDPVIYGGVFAREDVDEEDSADTDVTDGGVYDDTVDDDTDGAHQNTEQLVTVKVNGQDMQLPLSEVTRIAQTNLAADQRLEEVKSLYAQVRAEQAALAQNQGQNQPAPTPETNDTESGEQVNLDELREVADAIQTGDLDEAAEALARLTKNAQSSGQHQPTEPVDVRSTVEAMLVEERVRQSDRDAYASFAQENPDLVETPLKENMVRSRTLETMAIDLVNNGWDEAQITQIFNSSPLYIRDIHQYWRVNGYGDKLSNVPTILGHAKAWVENDLQSLTGNRPAPQPQPAAPNRQERKRSLQPQPRRANVPSPDGAQQPARKKSNAEILKEVRAYRGQM